MSKHNVFVDGRSIIHKGSGDKAIASAPDVCKTPVGSAVVPIPYPNISQSSTLKKGSKSIKINGQSAAVKGAILQSSNGDQAGRLGGIISGVTSKEIDFVTYSFGVKFEGKNVVRHADITMHNKKNTVGTVLGSAATVASIKDDTKEPECPYCKKERHPLAARWGSNIGDGQKLRRSIISRISDHKWYSKGYSLEAHHVICSESMDNDEWYNICHSFGYNINRKNNGVMLPGYLALACQLHVPLHRGNHSAGKAGSVSYPAKVSQELEKIASEVRQGKYCDNPKALVQKLDNLSKLILNKIDQFRWTITADGKDYKADGNGCANTHSVRKKPDSACKMGRNHRITNRKTSAVIPRNNTPLQIGT